MEEAALERLAGATAAIGAMTAGRERSAARGPACRLVMVRLAGAVAASGMVAAGCVRSASGVGKHAVLGLRACSVAAAGAAHLHAGLTLGWAAELAGHGSWRLHALKAWQLLCS